MSVLTFYHFLTAPIGFTILPFYQFCYFSALLMFTILQVVSHIRPACLTSLPIFRPCRFCRFTIRSIFGHTGFNICTILAPLLVLPFYQFLPIYHFIALVDFTVLQVVPVLPFAPIVGHTGFNICTIFRTPTGLTALPFFYEFTILLLLWILPLYKSYLISALSVLTFSPNFPPLPVSPFLPFVSISSLSAVTFLPLHLRP